MQNNNELYHYGVLGMKWGKRRALARMAKNEDLNRKVLKLEKRAAKYKLKSEKIHAKKDLGISNTLSTETKNAANKAAIKAAKYRVQSTKASA